MKALYPSIYISFGSRHWRTTRRGQTLVEYALILAFISIIAILVLKNLGDKTQGIYGSNNSTLDQALNFTGR